MRVLVRADAGPEIGLGHVMRCLALAGALRRLGGDVTFLGRGYVKPVRGQIESRGCRAVGLNEQDDLSATRGYARSLSADALIVDVGRVDETYLCALRDLEIILVSLDDGNAMRFPSHIVVNPNLLAAKLEYRSTTDDMRFLLGPKYFLLREEFAAARQSPRVISQWSERLLITMGGADPSRLAPKVIRAVAPLGLETVAICGSVSAEASEVEIVAAAHANVRTIAGPPNMARWMLWADVVVSAGGGTLYELAATGTPAVVLAQVQDQLRNAQSLEAAGTLICLGMGADVTEDVISAAVRTLDSDAARRAEMSQRGLALVDGKGAERVASAIEAAVGARQRGA